MRWWKQKRREEELERELEAHIELEAEELRGDVAAARRALGNRTAIKEDVRAVWVALWLAQFVDDFRYTVRTLARSPAFTTTAVLSLALGIGAATAIFSVVNGVLLRPLPYPEPERLVRLWEAKPTRGISRNVVNGWNFTDWRARTGSFEDMAAIQEIPMNLTGQGDPVSVPGMLVSSSFFSILRVPPMIGRGFTFEDESNNLSGGVVLSYKLYQTRFDSDPEILAKKVAVNGSLVSVLGVMPPGFIFAGSKAEIWVPMRVDRSKMWEGGRSLSTIARLRDGVTLERASEDLRAVARQLAVERASYDRDWTAEVIPMLQDATEGVRTALLVLLAAVGFLLAIACANVANLFLIRGAARSREVALRETLGASTFRLLRQFLTESLIVSLFASAVGVAIAHFSLRALLAMIPPGVSLPRVESIGLDARVFAFALAAVALTTVVFGLVPLAHSGRLDLQNTLRFRAGTASKGFRRVFVSAQVALAVVLLVGAGLMTRSFARLIAVDPGFATAKILAADIFPSPVRFGTPPKRSQYYEKILGEVRAAAGVEAASSIHFLPLEQKISASCFARGDGPPPSPATAPAADYWVIGSGYFATMGIPLLQGREFTDADRWGSPDVVVVNRAFARLYFTNENPIGKRIYLCWQAPMAEIVGVADDARQRGLRDPVRPTIFVANAQAPNFFATLVVRARQDPRQIAKSVGAAIHRVNPDQSVSAFRTMEEVLNASVARPRLQFVLLAIFAGAALLLAAIGIYGVLSYSVTQRTHEIGVRLAVGAAKGDIAALVLKEGMLLSAIGLIAGLGCAFALTRFLATLLFEITPTDPLTLGMACGLVALVTAAAISAPLGRSLRVDPVEALRYE